ncbi:MAG: hypothetical protein CL424_19100 [Acidimicrobiaceae bacterium]|nr:hypothetical protein [Acidimicrobiaceae bacterium]
MTRFAELSDRAILDARFTLSDAQRVVAADLGFGSWEELVASNEPPKPAPPPTLVRCRGVVCEASVSTVISSVVS